jgi:hypothetical protein
MAHEKLRGLMGQSFIEYRLAATTLQRTILLRKNKAVVLILHIKPLKRRP